MLLLPPFYSSRRPPRLPACRTAGAGCAIPSFDLVPRAVEGFMEALWAFQAVLHACCARSEPRASFFDSLVGQCSRLERTSSEPMARHGEGGTVRGMQRLLSAERGDEEPRLWHYPPLGAAEVGDPDGVLRFDATGFVNKGQDSVGGARQDCGLLGKVEPCQGGVCAGYAARQGYALVAQRLFLPAAGFTDV